jgi:threonine/homoserine/homoserine lactone efflux protein
MIISIFFAGALLGASVAAPVGPMGLLCIGRCLDRGLIAGLVIGLGIATGDMLYGGIAAFGFSAVTASVSQYAQPLRLAGGGFLIWLGVRAMMGHFFSRKPVPESQTQTIPPGSRSSDYLMAIGLTLTNPQTILSFIAAFAAIGVASNHGAMDDAIAVVAGVFVGSALWWLALCLVITQVRHALSPQARHWIGIASSGILIGVGALAALGALE